MARRKYNFYVQNISSPVLIVNSNCVICKSVIPHKSSVSCNVFGVNNNCAYVIKQITTLLHTTQTGYIYIYIGECVCVCVRVCVCILPSVYTSPSVVRSGPNFGPCHAGGIWGVLGGSEIENVGNLPNGWTD